MNFKSLRKKKWFSIASNIYVLVLTIFAVWMLFFDTNSYLIQRELDKEIKKLEKQKEFLKKEIEKDKETIKKLNNPEALERFAREQYYLKKDNEEIYIIEYQDSVKNKNDHE
jgi:cell division protein FtsB